MENNSLSAMELYDAALSGGAILSKPALNEIIALHCLHLPVAIIQTRYSFIKSAFN